MSQMRWIGHIVRVTDRHSTSNNMLNPFSLEEDRLHHGTWLIKATMSCPQVTGQSTLDSEHTIADVAVVRRELPDFSGRVLCRQLSLPKL